MQVLTPVPKHYDRPEFQKLLAAVVGDPFSETRRIEVASYLEQNRFDRVKSTLIRAQLRFAQAVNRDGRRAAKADIFGLFRNQGELRGWHETDRIIADTAYDIGGEGFKFDPKHRNHFWYISGFVSGVSTTAKNMLKSVADPVSHGVFGRPWAAVLPLRGIYLYDRDPEQQDGFYRWNNTETVGGVTEEDRHYGKIGEHEFAIKSDIPKQVFDKMRSACLTDKSGRHGLMVKFRAYETEADARLDLEQAAVNFLREAAGLDPVEWTPGPWMT